MLGLFLLWLCQFPAQARGPASLIAALLQLRIVKSFFVIAAEWSRCGIIMEFSLSA
jgi:hypothetical protein